MYFELIHVFMLKGVYVSLLQTQSEITVRMDLNGVHCTFGPGEKQLVSGIQAEHRFGVSLGHCHAL